MTHTYAEMDVSRQTYDEIALYLKNGGYDHAFMEDGAIDMHGIGLTTSGFERPGEPRYYSLSEVNVALADMLNKLPETHAVVYAEPIVRRASGASFESGQYGFTITVDRRPGYLQPGAK